NANSLQPAESGVPLVHVTHGRSFPQSAECPDAANPQYHLLANPHVIVTAVELRGDVPIFRGIFRDVRVQEIEWNPSDLNAPDTGPNFSAGKRDVDKKRQPIGFGFRYERKIEEIVFRIPFLLPAVDIEVLPKVPLAVHEPDAGEGNAEV